MAQWAELFILKTEQEVPEDLQDSFGLSDVDLVLYS